MPGTIGRPGYDMVPNNDILEPGTSSGEIDVLFLTGELHEFDRKNLETVNVY